MKERSKPKQQSNERDEYEKLCWEMQCQCTLSKEKDYNKICEELEDIERKHNPKLYTGIKNLQLRKPYAKAGFKNKVDKILLTTQEMLDGWEEYVRELCSDSMQKLIMTNEDDQKIERITEEEV